MLSYSTQSLQNVKDRLLLYYFATLFNYLFADIRQ